MIDTLLERIGLRTMPDADLDGLFALHRAYLETVPYEDLAVQLGETGPLDFPQRQAFPIPMFAPQPIAETNSPPASAYTEIHHPHSGCASHNRCTCRWSRSAL